MKNLILDIEEQLLLNGSVALVVKKNPTADERIQRAKEESQELRDIGQNNKDESVTNVLDLDPWDPNLTDAQKVAILNKCKENPFYLLTAVKGYKLQAIPVGIDVMRRQEEAEMSVQAFINRSKEAWNEIQKSAQKVTARLVKQNHERDLSKHSSNPLDRLEQSRLAKQKLLKRASAKKPR